MPQHLGSSLWGHPLEAPGQVKLPSLAATWGLAGQESLGPWATVWTGEASRELSAAKRSLSEPERSTSCICYFAPRTSVSSSSLSHYLVPLLIR